MIIFSSYFVEKHKKKKVEYENSREHSSNKKIQGNIENHTKTISHNEIIESAMDNTAQKDVKTITVQAQDNQDNTLTVESQAKVQEKIITNNLENVVCDSKQEIKTKTWDDLTEEEQAHYIDITIEYVYKTELEDENKSLTKQQKAFRKYCIDNKDYSLEDLDDEEKKIVEDFAKSVFKHKKVQKTNDEVKVENEINSNAYKSNEVRMKLNTKGLKSKWSSFSKLTKAMIIVLSVFVVYAILWGVIPNILSSNPATLGTAVSVSLVFSIIGFIFIFGTLVLECVGFAILMSRKHKKDLAQMLKNNKH